MFNLTALQLRFTCEALTPINLNGYNAGSNLRGALGNVMRRAYCGHMTPTPALPRSDGGGRQGGGSGCPVCWLLAANEHPGEERRGYALRPPMSSSLRGAHPERSVAKSKDSDEATSLLDGEIASHPSAPQRKDVTPLMPHAPGEREVWPGALGGTLAMTSGLYQPGQRFSFGLTLFGDAVRFLPYFILAVPEMGRNGVGTKMPQAVGGTGRGQFALRSVTAIDPLEGRDQIVLAEGESLVHVPDRLITAERVQTLTPTLSLTGRGRRAASGEGDRVRLNFLTPMRLIDAGQLVKAPDFGVLFKRLLERLDELNQQFAEGGPRAADDVHALQMLANQVRLIEAEMQWIELKSGSSRSGKTTWLSGFTGWAVYAAPVDVWRTLLPWLMWGAITQVGKDVVKGNGVFDIAGSRERGVENR